MVCCAVATVAGELGRWAAGPKACGRQPVKKTTALFLLLFFVFSWPLASKAELYALKTQVDPHDAGNVNVSVYNTHTEQVVWKHHFLQLETFAWSHDYQKLAFFVGQPDTNFVAAEIVIWQARQRQPRVYQKRLFTPNFKFYDGVFEMKWSPNDKLIGFRTWSGGGSYGQNVGVIWCLEPKTGRVRHVASRVGPMRWVNNRCLAFDKFGSYGPIVPSEPGDTGPIRRDDFASHSSYWTWR